MSFFKFFSTVMITGLGFGLEDTGLGLEENWPWPLRELALASKRTGLGVGLGLEDYTGLGLGIGLEHAVLEPIPVKSRQQQITLSIVAFAVSVETDRVLGLFGNSAFSFFCTVAFLFRQNFN